MSKKIKNKNTQANIRNNSTDIIANVTIEKIGKYKSKPIKVRNNVTINFLTGLARFARGDFRSEVSLSNNYLPMYLGVGKGKWEIGNEPIAKWKTLKEEIDRQWRYEASPNTISIDTGDDTAITLAIMSYIPSQSIVGEEIKELGLFSSRNFGTDTLLARVELEDSIVLSVGESLQVD